MPPLQPRAGAKVLLHTVDPRILIAEEPTTAVDVTVQAQVLGLLEESNVRGKARSSFISHDLAVVSRIADVDFPESDSPTTPRVSPVAAHIWASVYWDSWCRICGMSAGFGLVFDADRGICDMLSEEDTPAKANSH